MPGVPQIVKRHSFLNETNDEVLVSLQWNEIGFRISLSVSGKGTLVICLLIAAASRMMTINNIGRKRTSN